MQDILYNTIGTGYDSTRKADPFLLSRIFDLMQPSSKGKYLDIGCGTGNYTIALKEKGLEIAGIEPSDKMLDVASTKNDSIQWIAGRAEHIPFNDQTIDAVIAVLTIHHWSNIIDAFKEISRVLKENGRFVSFTSLPEQMKGYWLNHYFPGMMKASIQNMPSMMKIDEALCAVGLTKITEEKYFVANDLQDHFLYVGKNRPELYLDATIRNGISSFSNLAGKDEIQSGLSLLQQDMKTGNFINVQEQFENTVGDYLFIVAKK